MLDAEIVGDDVKSRSACSRDSRRPAPTCCRSSRTGAVQLTTFARSSPAIDGACTRDRYGFLSSTAPLIRQPFWRAVFAQHPRQFAGVDVGDAGNARVAQIRRRDPSVLRQLAATHGRSRITSPAAKMRVRLDVLGIDAGVADVRIGQRDDLSGVRGIGQDFLIAGHRRC